MKCAHCHAELSPGASFCGECGSPAPVSGAPVPAAPPGYASCDHCGARLAQGARFCGDCGQPVPAPLAGYGVPPAESRGRSPIWPVILVAAIVLFLVVALVAALAGGNRLAGLANRPGWQATPSPAVTMVVTAPAVATPVIVVVTSQPVQPTAAQAAIAADTSLPADASPSPPTLPATETPLPTATPLPTYTPLPTHTPLPTYTPFPTDTPPPPTSPPPPSPAPTKPPQPAPTQTPLPALSVTYRDFHYECRQNEVWTRGRPPYGDAYGDRSFQALMVITNQTADKTLEPLWRPDRWIVTNGSTEWEETYAWQYGKREGGVVKTYPQPPIGPGATGSWTWVCYPMDRGAWVKAAEFTAWGQTYRFEFPKPAPGEFNYVDCP